MRWHSFIFLLFSVFIIGQNGGVSGQDYDDEYYEDFDSNVIIDPAGFSPISIKSKQIPENIPKNVARKFLIPKDEFHESVKGILEAKNAIKHIKYFIYTRKNATMISKKSNWMSLYDGTKDTKIIIHGWLDNRKSDSVVLIRNAYVKTQKYNVIVCDWSEIGQDAWYNRAAHATVQVGLSVGKLIKRLVNTGNTTYQKIHMIGHSLGSHVASAAGKFTDERVSRITCLDPAAPCFESMESCTVMDQTTIISPRDARFVDVIHSCKGLVGIQGAIGNADFYPNGGGPIQPGCENKNHTLSEFSCSHSRSFEYFAESIGSDKFKAVKCRDYTQFWKRRCDKKIYIMGDGVSHDARGNFYLSTRSTAPYALDLIGTKWRRHPKLPQSNVPGKKKVLRGTA